MMVEEEGKAGRAEREARQGGDREEQGGEKKEEQGIMRREGDRK